MPEHDVRDGGPVDPGPVDGGDRSAPVRVRDRTGRSREVELRDVDDVEVPPGTLPTRLVVDGDGRRLVQKWVPRALGRADPTAYARLEAEVSACARLGYVYPGDPLSELPELVGYNLDLWEPFVLLAEYRGLPAATSSLASADEVAVQTAMVQAVALTAAAGLVHGNLTMDALRWDGTTFQITGFERAAFVGTERGPWAAGRPDLGPELAGGRGWHDPRDDVWALGRLLRMHTLGRHATGTDTSGDPPALRHLLHGVFEPATARPYPTELLHRLGTRPARDPVDPDAPLDEGRRHFDEALRRKHPDAADLLPAVSYVDPPGRGGDGPADDTRPLRAAGPARRSRSLVVAGLAVLAVLLVLVTVAFLGGGL